MFISPLLLATALLAAPSSFQDEEGATFHVRQTVSLSAIDKDAKSVQWWVSIPGDARGQEVLDMSVVDAPGPWKIVREPDHGNRFLCVEVDNPARDKLDVVVEFTLKRDKVSVRIDPTKVGDLDATKANLFADDLRRDAPHMEVTPAIIKLANETCGAETNPAIEAASLLQKVADLADHYSKDPSKPSCGVGDAAACLEQMGGCCTDLHSLFIAMARARGIPARLQMGYRLLKKNENKGEVDPGYRCWAEYFLPGYGWIPADIVEADALTGLGSFWFSGLTEERLWLNEGRDFQLDPAAGAEGVNHMSIGYALIDGVPARILPEGDLKPQLTRKIEFERIEDARTAALTASGGH